MVANRSIDVDSGAEALAAQIETLPLSALLAQARELARSVHGENVSFSRKVFIPLTRLCRDSCAYCTFAVAPSRVVVAAPGAAMAR